MRSKLPELRRETVEISKEEIRDRDWSNKLKGKAYADNRRAATPKSIRIGDAVLLRAEKSNKLSSNFNPSPFKVVNKTGAEVTVRNDAGAEFKQNTAFVKKYNQQDGNCAQDGEMTVPSETEMSVNSQLPPASSPEEGRRQQRVKKLFCGGHHEWLEGLCVSKTMFDFSLIRDFF